MSETMPVSKPMFAKCSQLSTYISLPGVFGQFLACICRGELVCSEGRKRVASLGDIRYTSDCIASSDIARDATAPASGAANDLWPCPRGIRMRPMAIGQRTLIGQRPDTQETDNSGIRNCLLGNVF